VVKDANQQLKKQDQVTACSIQTNQSSNADEAMVLVGEATQSNDKSNEKTNENVQVNESLNPIGDDILNKSGIRITLLYNGKKKCA
jgi:hypothetical protein